MSSLIPSFSSPRWTNSLPSSRAARTEQLNPPLSSNSAHFSSPRFQTFETLDRFIPHTACDRFGAAIPCRTRLLAAHFRTHEALLPPPRCVLSRLIVCLRSLAISSNSPTCFPSWLAVWCWYFFLLRWRNLVVCVLGFEFSVGLCCLR